MFNFGKYTLILLAASVGLLILLLLVLLIRKKNGKVSGGKKFLTGLLVFLCSFSFIATSLVHLNIIPLNLHLGLYIEEYDYNGDGKTSGIKITMERRFSYYENTTEYDLINRTGGKKSSEGAYYLEGNIVFLKFEGSSYNTRFEIKGLDLYDEYGNLVYKYIHDIDMR